MEAGRNERAGEGRGIFVHDEVLANEVRRALSLDALELEAGWTGDFGPALLDKALSAFQPMLLAENSPANNAELLFHVCMEVGRLRADLFAVTDVALLAANLLDARHGPLTDKTVACLDWTLFPAALLVAGRAAQVILPLDAVKSLPNTLGKAIPDSTWVLPKDSQASQVKLPSGVLILGGHPVIHTETTPGFLDSLSGIAGGVFFCYWDFLDVALHDHVRGQWLKSGLLRSVIQLPRPRRQSAMHYPALVELGAKPATGAAATSIRLALLMDSFRGPGGLPQAEAVALLTVPTLPDAEKALDMSPEALYLKGSVDLKPGYHLARQAVPQLASGTPIRLADCAHVIRCQLPRAKEDATPLMAEAAFTGAPVGGLMSDGSFVCREIILNDVDPITGFIKEYGELTRVGSLNPEGRQGKYLLRPDDIVMVFRGTEPSIGKVGFMDADHETPSITGQSLCIIRAFDTDPVWLYYYLQRETTRRWIVSQATGSKMLTVNLSDLRGLPLVMPGAQEVETVNEHHHRVVKYVEEVRRLERNITSELLLLRTVPENLQ